MTCWEGEHLTLVAYAGAMVLVYTIGTPCLYAALLYANSEELEKIKRAETIADADAQKLRVLKETLFSQKKVNLSTPVCS